MEEAGNADIHGVVSSLLPLKRSNNYYHGQLRDGKQFAFCASNHQKMLEEFKEICNCQIKTSNQDSISSRFWLEEQLRSFLEVSKMEFQEIEAVEINLMKLSRLP